jgi:hypothetical protein
VVSSPLEEIVNKDETPKDSNSDSASW